MNHLPLVEPFAAGLEKIAAAMDDAGIGGHLTYGHAGTLRRMAASMRADAVNGKLPHRFDDGVGPMYAGGAAPKPQQLSAATVRACPSLGLDAASDRIDLGQLNAALSKSGMTSGQRFALKTELASAGLID